MMETNDQKRNVRRWTQTALAAVLLAALIMGAAVFRDSLTPAAIGQRLLGAGREKSALPHLLRAAEDNDADAMYVLGLLYKGNEEGGEENEEGIEDPAEAVKWFSRSAELGDEYAMVELGEAYRDGYGVERDPDRALELFRAAAAKDVERAFYDIGLCYEQGIGAAADATEAVKWFRRAAQCGEEDAQKSLGDAYRDGRGVEQNDAEAFKWYRRAAEQENSDAVVCVGLCYEMGRGVTANMKRAAEEYRTAADLGNTKGMLRLALAYRDGRGVGQDVPEMGKPWWLSQSSILPANGLNETIKKQFDCSHRLRSRVCRLLSSLSLCAMRRGMACRRAMQMPCASTEARLR